VNWESLSQSSVWSLSVLGLVTPFALSRDMLAHGMARPITEAWDGFEYTGWNALHPQAALPPRRLPYRVRLDSIGGESTRARDAVEATCAACCDACKMACPPCGLTWALRMHQSCTLFGQARAPSAFASAPAASFDTCDPPPGVARTDGMDCPMAFECPYGSAAPDKEEYFFMSCIKHERVFTGAMDKQNEAVPAMSKARAECCPRLPHKHRSPCPSPPCAFGSAAQDADNENDAGGTVVVKDLALSNLDRNQVAWLGIFANEVGSSSRGYPRDHEEKVSQEDPELDTPPPPMRSLPAEFHASTPPLPKNEPKWSMLRHAVSHAFVSPSPSFPDVIEVKMRGESRREQIYRACPGCRKAKAKCSGGRPCRRCVKRKNIDECLADDATALRAHQRAKLRRMQLTAPFKIAVGNQPSGFPLSWRDDCESSDEAQSGGSTATSDVQDLQVSYAALLASGVRGGRRMTHTADVKVESPSCTAERKALDSGLEPHGQELATMPSTGICIFQGKLVAMTELDMAEAFT